MLDYLVIGGGIAGVSAAARLSSHGQTLVLEAEDHIAYHTSGRSAALFEENYGSSSTLALARASHDYLKTAHGGVLSPRGFMLLCGAGEDQAFDADLAQMDLSEVPMDAAQSRCPILNPNFVSRAAVSETAQDIDTDLMIQNFARDLRANNGAVATKQKVVRIVKSRHGWQVETKTDSFEASHIVNAAGAWGDSIATLADKKPIGLTPYRRSMARIAAPGGHDVSKWPMLFGPGERWYAKPDAGAWIVSLAEETPSPPMDAWADDMDIAEAFARYQPYVTTDVTRPLATWAGLRTFAPDRNLVLGPDPKDASFIWCVGQGGYGFFTAPAASQLVADLTLGHAPTIDAKSVRSLSPARFS